MTTRSAEKDAPRQFHESLDRQTADLWAAIFALPFIREIGRGTLDERRFAFFIAEDLLYLDDFARVLTRAAAWADKRETQRCLLQHAQRVHAVEQSLHGNLIPRLGIDVETLRRREPAPVTVAYTDHLFRIAAAGPLAEIIAAVLPCYWVYHRVGAKLSADPPDHALFRSWIQAYSTPEFGQAVTGQLTLLDELAEHAGPVTRQRMERWFERSLRYEWMFWDQAYRQADWPIGGQRSSPVQVDP